MSKIAVLESKKKTYRGKKQYWVISRKDDNACCVGAWDDILPAIEKAEKLKAKGKENVEIVYATDEELTDWQIEGIMGWLKVNGFLE